jgi:hypothetical protein
MPTATAELLFARLGGCYYDVLKCMSLALKGNGRTVFAKSDRE